MKNLRLLLLLCLCTGWPGLRVPAQTAAANTLAGDWEGKIAGQLPLVLHLRADAGGGLTAVVDSPTQNANGLAGADVQLAGKTLTFTVPVVQGSYTGTVTDDGKTITGIWHQRGQSAPLALHLTATAEQLRGLKPSPLDGDWTGVLRAGGVSLRLVFHFHAAPGGAIAGSLDSLDQGAMGIPCTDVQLREHKLTLQVPAVHGTYEGTLSDDGDRISGTWSQGHPLPLDLTRSAAKPFTPPKTAPAQPPVAIRDLEPTLQKEFAPVIASWPQSGVVIGVLDHGEQRVMAFGAAKPNSIFEIGSVTKTFTALVLAQMVVQKKVTLDEPVRELLPAGWVGKPAGPEITLLDLATQHSGLPRLPDNLQPANPADPYADYSAQRLEAFLKQHGVARPEKTDFLYSNLGVGLLGFALAQRAGISYGDLIRDEITAPMGLKDTEIVLSPEQQSRFIQGYNGAHDRVGPWRLDALAGAGALRSTASDLLIYCATLMHPDRLTGQNGDGATLTEAIPLVLQPRADAGGMKIALAWLIRPEQGIYWHNGGTGGYTSLVVFDPQRDRAIVVLYNCEDMGAPGMTDRIAANVTALLDGKPALSLQ